MLADFVMVGAGIGALAALNGVISGCAAGPLGAILALAGLVGIIVFLYRREYKGKEWRP